jgi:hypothetical protein
MGLLDAFSAKPASPGGGSTAPQGLLDLLLGSQNPVSQFADSRQNVLGAIGAGLAAGPTLSAGLSQAAQNIPQARQRDYQTNLLKGQVSQTVAYLQKTHPDIAQAVQAGAMSPAEGFQLAFSQDNAPPTVMAPGSTARYLQGPKAGQTVGDPQSGFYGGDLKSQAWNTVLKGAQDPAQRNTDQYRAAWAIVTEPTMTPQGMMQPNVPSQWAPDSPAAATPAPSAPAPSSAAPGLPAPAGAPSPTSAALGDMQMVAPAAPAATVPGIVPGTRPYNESQSRMELLIQSATPDLKRVIDGYPALMSTKDQLLGKLPGDIGRLAQSPEYKQANDAVTSAMSNLLYVASGANLNAGELERKVQAYVPSINDDPQTAANKLDRFANDVMVTANATKDPLTIAWAQQAVQGLAATRQKILSSGSPAPSGQSVPAGTTIYGPDGKQYIMGRDGNPQPVT